MGNTSEYQIPIFISSTHYNLIDLRAELCRFLGELGYRPILSSSEGFPDRSPILEPCESCLKVIEDNCFIMILIIDAKYGKKLSWPHFKTILSKNTVNNPCPNCGGKIVKEAYLGGAVYFCSSCQKL